MKEEKLFFGLLMDILACSGNYTRMSILVGSEVKYVNIELSIGELRKKLGLKLNYLIVAKCFLKEGFENPIVKSIAVFKTNFENIYELEEEN